MRITFDQCYLVVLISPRHNVIRVESGKNSESKNLPMHRQRKQHDKNRNTESFGCKFGLRGLHCGNANARLDTNFFSRSNQSGNKPIYWFFGSKLHGELVPVWANVRFCLTQTQNSSCAMRNVHYENHRSTGLSVGHSLYAFAPKVIINRQIEKSAGRLWQKTRCSIPLKFSVQQRTFFH